MIKNLAARTTPLCFLPDGKLVCYQQGSVILYDDCFEVKRLTAITTRKERIFGRFRILSRILRLGIRAAIAVDDSAIIFSLGNIIYEFNVIDGHLSKGYTCDDGVRPLSFSHISGIYGFDDGVYFGGYVRNFEKNPVHIYYRNGVDAWKIVYTFPQGAINHVHSIIADSYRRCLWILTGDFDDSAAIWKVSDGFKRVERFVSGDQKWRGCVAFAIPDGLLYATDAPFAKNHIYLLKEDGKSSIVGDLSGSCIYGCNWKDKYVFSTVVEPDGRNESMLRLLFGWKRGSGIIDNNARIYWGDIKDGFIELYKENKDYYPFIFQFGAFKFPSGINNTENLYFQPMATAKNDMRLIGFSL